MPHPNWTHTCRKTGRTRSDWKLFRCWRCLGQAEFAGWSQSVVEMMGDYQRRYGLKCLGPHRKLADETLKGAFTRCGACEGAGVVDDGSHESWVLCAPCDGLGMLRAVPEEEIERRRAVVLAAFPDAASPQPRRVAPGVHAGTNAGRPGTPVSSSRTQLVSAVPLRRISTEKPDLGELIRAGFSVLILAPAWLFASLWTFREGRVLVGLVFLFASGFAALSGLMTAAPDSFDRRWLWIWGGVGVGFVLFLVLVGGQAACATPAGHAQ